MARLTKEPGEFWADEIKRPYKGVVRWVWRAYWIDQDGNEKTKDNRLWRREADALAFARKKAGEVRDGVYVSPGNSWTFEEAGRVHVADLKELKRSWSYVRVTGYKLKLLNEKFESTPCQNIDPDKLERFLIHDLINRRGYAVSYVQEILSLAGEVLDTAVRGKKLKINQVRGYKFRLPTEPFKQRFIPEHEHVVKILNGLEYRRYNGAASTHRALRMCAYLVGYAGLRSCEACGLQVENVNWKKKIIQVRHSYPNHGDGLKEMLKTSAGNRDVDIFAILESELEDYFPTLDGRETGFLLPPGVLGMPWRPRDFNNAFRELMLQIGLTNEAGDEPLFTPYALRGYAGSVWLQAWGSDALVRVSRMIGHASVKTTEKYYLKLLAELDPDRYARIATVDGHVRRQYDAHGLKPSLRPKPTPPTIDGEVTEIRTVPVHVPAARLLAPTEERARRQSLMFELNGEGASSEIISARTGYTEETIKKLLRGKRQPRTFKSGPASVAEAEAKQVAIDEARALYERMPEPGQMPMTLTDVAQKLNIQLATVQVWRRRFNWKAPPMPDQGLVEAAIRERMRFVIANVCHSLANFSLLSGVSMSKLSMFMHEKQGLGREVQPKIETALAQIEADTSSGVS